MMMMMFLLHPSAIVEISKINVVFMFKESRAVAKKSHDAPLMRLRHMVLL